MHPTLFVDAFGRLVPIPERVDPSQYVPNDVSETLWSTFLDRSVHMRWATEGSAGTSRVWDVQEAEITYHLGSSRIGFAQVGLEVKSASPDLSNITVLDEPPPGIDRSQGGWAAVPMLDDAEPPTEPALAISPLIQCLDDSLRWYGETEVDAYQVTGYDLLPSQTRHPLGSLLSWFCVPIAAEITPATITLASSQGGDRLVSDVLDRIQGTGHTFFEIGPLLDAPDEVAAGLDWKWLQLTRGEVGIAVSLPEWSTAAVGWLIGTVFNAALSMEPAPHALSVRVTRA
ncbi:MAG: hypothetical protein OXD50_11510 [Chloroflexi bacterium]|nr:hypothetical protein [Chloroflexota bacterium]